MNRLVPQSVAVAALCLMAVSTSVQAQNPAPEAASYPIGVLPPGKARPAWMNEKGEVLDPAKVESGFGTAVKGLNGWEGEVTGIPAPGSKFTELKIGMPMKQATDIVGVPTDQGAYVTGKAWIPFYFGSDRYRYEVVYKGLGRLIFAGSSGIGISSSGNLIWIIHSANEGGYR